MSIVKRNILLNPGPATTTDSVKQAQVVADICPREEEFCAILKGIRSDLVRIAGGDSGHAAVLFSGSGTAVMDAVINSVVPPGRKLLVVVNGAYGERMANIAQAYRIPCVAVNFGWGEKIDYARVRQVLESGTGIGCVAMVHHETTTGMLNPLEEMGEICARSGQVFVVDAISSFAGIPFSVQECGIDFLISTSNKCLQGMAGLGFAVCRIGALERIRDYPPRSFYLDLSAEHLHVEQTGQPRFTPPVQTVYALKQAIREYFEEGGGNRYRRYTDSWRVLRRGLLDLGFELLLAEEDESHILLTVHEPERPGYDFAGMHDTLRERGFTIYPGKVGHRRTFRLAVMGAIYPSDIRDFLAALGEYCREHLR